LKLGYKKAIVAMEADFPDATLDPAYGVLQKHEVIQRSLTQIYDEARGFLSSFSKAKRQVDF